MGFPWFPHLNRADPAASGNETMASLGQLAVMAAVVATLGYFPLGLALILVFHFAGVGFETLISFGATFPIFVGLVVWWLLAFMAASLYAVFMFPWAHDAFVRPGEGKMKEGRPR